MTHQVVAVLQQCGLDDKLRRIQERDAQAAAGQPLAPLAEVEGMDVASLSPVLQSFYSMALSLSALPHCDRILNSLVRRTARQTIAVHVCTYYKAFYSAVTDAVGGGYVPGELASVLVHTPDSVNTLLEVPNK